MIKTIIFDFGGVLVKDTVEEFENYHDWKKLPLKLQQQHWNNIKKCELGQISYKELFKRMQKIMAPKLSWKDVQKQIEFHSKVLPPFYLLNKLASARSYQILILSNNFKGWPREMWRAVKIKPPKVPFLNSALIHARKTNGKAFKYVIKKYKLIPENCVFIDDNIYNINAAKKLGIKTFKYHNNFSDLKKFLKNLGVRGT